MSGAVALTAGEPAGVGLELAPAAWRQLRLDLPFYLIADRRHVRAACGLGPVEEIGHPAEAVQAMESALPFYHIPFPDKVAPGVPSLRNASAVTESIRLAVDHVQRGDASAVCTNPVSKSILRRGGGFPFPGQTEFLAHLVGAERSAMMLASPLLRVVPVTTHMAIADVPGALGQAHLKWTIETTLNALERGFGVPRPRLVVAGLNPHAGEEGLLGSEEEEIIRPVISELRARGVSVAGPQSADTMFHAEARERYDAAICMFHDQALIPFKTISFHDGVNVTLGLPIVRTSPDHGPALDIAGSGRARPDSLVAAIRLAARLSAGQRTAA